MIRAEDLGWRARPQARDRYGGSENQRYTRWVAEPGQRPAPSTSIEQQKENTVVINAIGTYKSRISITANMGTGPIGNPRPRNREPTRTNNPNTVSKKTRATKEERERPNPNKTQ